SLTIDQRDDSIAPFIRQQLAIAKARPIDVGAIRIVQIAVMNFDTGSADLTKSLYDICSTISRCITQSHYCLTIGVRAAQMHVYVAIVVNDQMPAASQCIHNYDCPKFFGKRDASVVRIRNKGNWLLFFLSAAGDQQQNQKKKV